LLSTHYIKRETVAGMGVEIYIGIMKLEQIITNVKLGKLRADF